MNDMVPGLIITAIGMGLVFAAIVLLWGLMALMVRMDGKVSPAAAAPSVSDSENEATAIDAHQLQAAAAALAFALAQKETRQAPVSAGSRDPVGAWQAIQRAQALQDKSRIFAHRHTRRS